MSKGSNVARRQNLLTLVNGRSKGEEGPDPAAFRIPASDAKGHTTRMWFRVQPAMGSQVEKIVQSKAFPYRTKGDVLRHALYKHLKWVVQHEGIPSLMGQVDAILEIVRDDEFSSELEHVMSKVGERINYYMGMGEVGEARKMLLKVQGHIDSMPDDYWKKRYQKELTSRYGHVLADAPKADLRPNNDQD